MKKRPEHNLQFRSDKKCSKCGKKYVIEGGIKSVSRSKTCPDCRNKVKKKHNDIWNEKKKKK